MLKRLDANPNRDKKNFIMDALENIVEKYMYIRDVGSNNIKIQKSKIPYV